MRSVPLGGPIVSDNNSRLQFDNNNLDTQGTGSLLKLRKGLRVGTFNTRTCHSAAEADEIALDLKAAGGDGVWHAGAPPAGGGA